MKSSLIRSWAWLLASGVLWLSGCANTLTLDNRVQSSSQLTDLPAPATFRFEPTSQGPLDHAQLEALANPVLSQAGFRRDDSNPRFSVSVSTSVDPMLSPWADPWGFGYGRQYSYYGMWSGQDFPWYHREVRLIIRDLKSNQVVYETRAITEGPWHKDATVLPAMFQAAMEGFPAPSPGPRRVNITLPS